MSGGVPRQIVVDDRVEELLKVDPFRQAVCRHKDTLFVLFVIGRRHVGHAMAAIQLGLCAVAALASAGCADTVVNRTELAMPKGFTLYMVKAILSGRGDEVIDLARTNLWR